ncbi:MAG: aminotransferase class I/II-fold pyridoxal phosphate-dependent enzyme, partial [Pseudomonadota bacterium]
ELGREMFFPRGIIMQSAEARAKAKKFNATIGMATEAGHAMFLPSVMECVSGLTPDEALKYAPVAGIPELRAAWKEKILRDNPGLAGKPMSLPVVTNGLTHALSIVADLFCDAGDALILPDKIWGNYRLTFCARRGARVVSYPFYADNRGFNVAGFKAAVEKACETGGKIIALMNFPNNPTGYSPTRTEAGAIASALLAAADRGTNVIALSDDAYFGLFYDEEVMPESLFSLLAGAHERLLAIKGDAATKEVFVWGLRVGFLSFSVGNADEDSPLYAALEKKVSGAIRSVISNCSMLSQRVVLKAMQSPGFEAERNGKREILKQRALEVKRVLADEKFAEVFSPYPFNSGYFMCVRLKSISAEALRQHLLDQHAVGTIATGEHDLRVAFSCVEAAHVQELFDTIYAAAKELND